MRPPSRAPLRFGSSVLTLLICWSVVANAQQDTLRAPPRADSASVDSATVPHSASEAESSGMKLIGLYDADDGHWISGATVRDTLGNEVVTSAIGVALLNQLTPIAGYYLIEIRKPGYSPRSIRFRMDTTSEFMLPLAPNPLGEGNTLPTVVVTAKLRLTEDAGLKEGFIYRCQTELISCVGRAELDRHPAGGLDAFLSHVDGIDRTCVVHSHGPGSSTASSGFRPSTQCVVGMQTLAGDQPRCTPTYYVDGYEWRALGGGNAQGDIDQYLNRVNIAGIEVYLPGHPAPPRFASPFTNCGSVVIWTR